MRRYVIVLTGVAAALLAFVAWAGVWRPAMVLRHAGVSAWWPEALRTCRDAPLGGWRNCEQTRAITATTLEDHEQVGFHRFARTVAFAQHSWQVRDSVRWRRAADSVRQALTLSGGTPVPCPQFSESDDIASIDAWRFGDHDVRFMTYHLHTALPRPSIAWGLQVIAMPVGHTGCASRQTVRRLLTPSELVARFQRWLLANDRAARPLP